MRNLLILFTLLTAFISCSKDEPTKQKEFPTNITFDPESVAIGEILTINGNGFLPNEVYTVTFSEGKIATITEIASNYLKVETPENAISGDVTLTFNNQTKTIGSIEITRIYTSELYIFHDSEDKLAKIDLATGNLTYIGNNIDYGANSVGAVYHSANNEYVGFEQTINGPRFLRINLEDGSTTITNIPSSFLTNGVDFSDLIIDDNNEVYIFHDAEKKLAKIDITTGNITYIGSNIDYGANSVGAVYHSANNEYIGFEQTINGPRFLRISLEDGSTTITNIPSSFLTNGVDFSDLAIDSNNEVYIFHDAEDKLAKIDLATGNLTYIGNNIKYGLNTRGAVYNIVNNEYIGFENLFTNPFLVRISLEDGTTSKTTIPSSFLTNGKDFSDLIIVTK